MNKKITIILIINLLLIFAVAFGAVILLSKNIPEANTGSITFNLSNKES